MFLSFFTCCTVVVRVGDDYATKQNQTKGSLCRYACIHTWVQDGNLRPFHAHVRYRTYYLYSHLNSWYFLLLLSSEGVDFDYGSCYCCCPLSFSMCNYISTLTARIV